MHSVVIAVSKNISETILAEQRSTPNKSNSIHLLSLQFSFTCYSTHSSKALSCVASNVCAKAVTNHMNV